MEEERRISVAAFPMAYMLICKRGRHCPIGDKNWILEGM